MTDWPPDPFEDDEPPDRHEGPNDLGTSGFDSEWQFESVVGEAWESSRQRDRPEPD
jgi:hypothetical protein